MTVDTSVVAKQDPSAPTYSLADATVHEHQLFDAINAARTSAGLPTLTWNPQVAYVAHHAPPGSALTLPHQPFGKISLDLATAPTVEGALRAWMSNENQRAHLLDRGAKQICVAVSVQPEDEIQASVVLLGVPPRIDPIGLDRKIEDALETHWRRVDSDLRTTAQVVAALIARGATEQVKPELTARLGGIATRFSMMYNSITRLEDPDRLDTGKIIGDQFATKDRIAYGIGVAQAPEVDGGAIYIVAVYGRIGR